MGKGQSSIEFLLGLAVLMVCVAVFSGIFSGILENAGISAGRQKAFASAQECAVIAEALAANPEIIVGNVKCVFVDGKSAADFNNSLVYAETFADAGISSSAKGFMVKVHGRHYR